MDRDGGRRCKESYRLPLPSLFTWPDGSWKKWNCGTTCMRAPACRRELLQIIGNRPMWHQRTKKGDKKAIGQSPSQVFLENFTSVPGKIIDPEDRTHQANSAWLPTKPISDSNLVSYLDHITELMDNGDDVHFRQRQSHEKLVHMIERFEIKGQLLVWVKQWLTDWQQRACLNGKVTGRKPSHHQWFRAVFRACSFLTCLAMTLNCSKVWEDVQIRRRLQAVWKDHQRLAEITTTEYKSGLKSGGMAINQEKCHIVHIAKKNKRTKYMIKRKTWASVHQSAKPLSNVWRLCPKLTKS